MSEPTAASTTGDVPPDEEGEPLQFDQAEFTTPVAERPTCSVCHQAIPEEYYEINQRIMCPQCRHGVEAAFRGGSGTARFLKATAFGLLAAAVGAVLYYGFVRLTDWNLALVSILVGFMVGTAVRKGTGNRGGRIYQLLAVFLTYTSIAAMLTPFALEALRDHRPKENAAQPGPEKVDQEPVKVAAPDAPGGQQAAAPPRPASLLVLVLVFTILVYALPLLHSHADLISGLIFAFALWEAWKINRPIRLVFNGPFRIGEAGAAAIGPEGAAHGT
jgi:hypothetical protein